MYLFNYLDSVKDSARTGRAEVDLLNFLFRNYNYDALPSLPGKAVNLTFDLAIRQVLDMVREFTFVMIFLELNQLILMIITKCILSPSEVSKK